MKKINPIEFATGFFMGVIFGFFIDGVFIMIYNLLCTWLGWKSINLVWWMWIPLPIVSGLIMGKTIASLHLEDY